MSIHREFMSRTIRRWALHHRSDKSLQELAAMYNLCNPRLDKLLRPILSHAVASDSDEDRCLCHPLGASQIQAAPTSDQRRQRLVCPATPRHSNALRPLAAMLRQRPNIGSRVNREVHARFWERAEVKFLRTTRYQRRFERAPGSSALPPISDVLLCRGK
jgi:hypothetical protein